MNMHKTVKQILETTKLGSQCAISAWVRTKRSSGAILFLELNDGSSHDSLQVVVEEGNFSSQSEDSELFASINTGTCLHVEGELVSSPAKGQAVELHARELRIEGPCPLDYPLQKKKHSFEFLRSIPHLRSRTNSLKAIARIRHALAQAIHQFFSDRDFFYIHTPIISGIDAEGAGEVFTIQKSEAGVTEDFFAKPTFLTVSGQLHVECYALALGRVYTFAPTFRAENSNTSRHLSEFWMVEPEICFTDIEGLANLADELVRYLVAKMLDEQRKDLEFFDKWIEQGLCSRLEKVVLAPSKHISYDEAIKILHASGKSFEHEARWGEDLQTEHERYLCEEWYRGPVIVYNYPRDIKAFYMRRNSDGKTVAAMDMLVPVFGEIVGGSQREERLEMLEQSMLEKNIDRNQYNWYLDLRRYGTAVHSGFGMGFDRVVQYLTGMKNIRDSIPFPRTPGYAPC